MLLLERDRIESSANQLLNTLAVENTPIDVVTIAKELDVKVHYEHLEDEISGMLVVKNGEKHIIVNRSHHPNRQRFTIAHEIGHLKLHYKTGDEVFLDTKLMVYHRSGIAEKYSNPHATTTPKQEREANFFASCLLMPKKTVEEFVDSQGIEGFDEFDVVKLAYTFDVSEQAMSIRLSNLKLIESY